MTSCGAATRCQVWQRHGRSEPGYTPRGPSYVTHLFDTMLCIAARAAHRSLRISGSQRIFAVTRVEDGPLGGVARVCDRTWFDRTPGCLVPRPRHSGGAGKGVV